MRITAISDIHGDLPNIDSTDLLLICGDWSPLHIQCKFWSMCTWLREVFIPYLSSIQAQKIIFIAGNHDFICDPYFTNFPYVDFVRDILNPLLRKHNIFSKVKYLQNSYTIFNNYRIYGCPYVEGCRGWAFSQADFKNVYSRITKCDILITHQPPVYNGIAHTQINNVWYELGSYSLLEVVQKKKPMLLFCGHIHGGDHSKQILTHIDSTYTTMYNVSMKDENYNMVFPPTVIEI